MNETDAARTLDPETEAPEAEVVPISELLDAACRRRGWTQAELSRRAGVAPPEVNRILKGKRKLNSTRLMDGIAEALSGTAREGDPAATYADWLALMMRAPS